MRNAETRFADGVLWETAVGSALAARGWDVEPFGQALLSPRARSWLRGGLAPLRWLPDLLVHRDGVTVAVDAKGGWGFRDTGRHDVERASAIAGCEFEELAGLDEWFVFRDGRCARPSWVLERGVVGPYRGNGSGTPFLLIDAEMCVAVDDVFGRASR